MCIWWTNCMWREQNAPTQHHIRLFKQRQLWRWIPKTQINGTVIEEDKFWNHDWEVRRYKWWCEVKGWLLSALMEQSLQGYNEKYGGKCNIKTSKCVEEYDGKWLHAESMTILIFLRYSTIRITVYTLFYVVLRILSLILQMMGCRIYECVDKMLRMCKARICRCILAKF